MAGLFPFLRTARFYGKDEMAAILDDMPEDLFSEMAEQALATGAPLAIMKAISAGRVPEGYERFFENKVVVPAVVDVDVITQGSSVVLDMAVKSVDPDGVAAADWVAHPQQSDANVLSSVLGDDDVTGDADVSVARGAHPDIPDSAMQLYRPGVERPPLNIQSGPDSIAGGHFRAVPSFDVTTAKGERKKAVYLHEGLLLVGERAGGLAGTANDIWVTGKRTVDVREYYGDPYIVSQSNCFATAVSWGDVREGSCVWDPGSRGGYPSGYPDFVAGTLIAKTIRERVVGDGGKAG